MEEILRAVHFYRYITAIDVAQLFFSAKSLTHVREILNILCGGEDDQRGQYLCRFSLPSAKARNTTKVYTLGSVVHGSEVCTQRLQSLFGVRRCGHSSGVPAPACG